MEDTDFDAFINDINQQRELLSRKIKEFQLFQQDVMFLRKKAVTDMSAHQNLSKVEKELVEVLNPLNLKLMSGINVFDENIQGLHKITGKLDSVGSDRISTQSKSKWRNFNKKYI